MTQTRREKIFAALRELADESGDVNATNRQIYERAFKRPAPDRQYAEVSEALRELGNRGTIVYETHVRTIKILS